MTDEELIAIEARWTAATPGPWDYAPDLTHAAVWHGGGIVCRTGLHGQPNVVEDAQAIASAPSDIATLIAEVRRARAELALLRPAGRAVVRFDNTLYDAAIGRISGAAEDAALVECETEVAVVAGILKRAGWKGEDVK